MLAALVPTVLMTAIGIILVASGGSKSLSIVGGILVLAFCATALAGYTMGNIFVNRGANLALVHARPTSSPILQRLGFAVFGQRKIWSLPR